MITRVEGGLTYTQTFDPENRLISVTVNSQTTQFIYDGDGNLVKKIKPDGSKTLYVGGIYEVDKTSGGSVTRTVTRTVTYYPAAGAMRIDSTLYYMLKDHLGSASVMTNTSGVTVGEQRYYPFGETRLTTGSIFTDRLFTGQREIAGLGIYHYNARFYSPKLGRFLSADSIVPNPYNPQDLNRFSYVRNNPLRYIDPTGHVACRTKEECQEMGTTPGGGFRKPQPNPASGGTSTRRDRRAGGEVDSDFAILPPLNPGGGGHPLPMPNPNPGSGNNNPDDILTPPPFTQSSLASNVSIPPLPPSPFACGWFDCALSAVSTIMSALTMSKVPEIAVPAFFIDLGATFVAYNHTNDDYRQGEISQTRQWALNGTGILGLVPGTIGFGFSIANAAVTIFGIIE